MAEINAIRCGDRVSVKDVPRLIGIVTHCDSDGVQVQWDDGRIGDLIWDDRVAYNAYRLQVVVKEIE